MELLDIIKDALDNNAIHRFNLYFKKVLKSDIIHYKNANNYYNYIYDIQISCAMIIQAFTGMSMSELMSIKKNCIKKEEVIYNNKKYNHSQTPLNYIKNILHQKIPVISFCSLFLMTFL